ncbi:sigma-70 family RNA polymerase sigma factor [Variovorax saccharolyticus]|uniref:sigma-70 family RNA polymerase sigma factor n=1 Tax=Variovorax saccharolyticus TaxID=3053516 RepID=UPI00257617BB|nr:sigma-70 family RNA polymerase sigma factor [Variovorax sp. J22R187]MDM0019286.1 sigma-70 family RNA polymerase sigma factor [Variovorax sp. J22R187]
MSAPDPFDYDAALAACARGERQALAQIYQREGRYLLGVALRIVRQRQSAEDVLHDAFVSIWQRACSFDPGRGAGRGWIYSVVRHAALNWVRSHGREVPVDEERQAALEDELALDRHAGSLDPAETRAELGRLETCLDRLEPERRECIVLAYLDGCSHGEIAQRTHKPLGTIKSWIQRGMRSLRECMA